MGKIKSKMKMKGTDIKRYINAAFWIGMLYLASGGGNISWLSQAAGYVLSFVALVLLVALIIAGLGFITVFASQPSSRATEPEARAATATEQEHPEESPSFQQALAALSKLRFSKSEAHALARAAWKQGARKTEELVSQALRLRGSL